MHNDSNRISANEINRYVYCNYQWYYRRYYGNKALNKLKKDHNIAMGIKIDPRIHAFVKGTKFHRSYHIRYKVKQILYLLLVIATIATAIWILAHK